MAGARALWLSVMMMIVRAIATHCCPFSRWMANPTNRAVTNKEWPFGYLFGHLLLSTHGCSHAHDRADAPKQHGRWMSTSSWKFFHFFQPKEKTRCNSNPSGERSYLMTGGRLSSGEKCHVVHRLVSSDDRWCNTDRPFIFDWQMMMSRFGSRPRVRGPEKVFKYFYIFPNVANI